MSSMCHLWAYKMPYVVKCLHAILISNDQNTCIQTKVMQLHQCIAYNAPLFEENKTKITERHACRSVIFVILISPIYTA